MVSRIPEVNLIRDTPVSPNHRPVLLHSSSPSSSSESSYPEVDTTSRDTYEGLQVDPNGPYPQPTTSDDDIKHKWWHIGGSSEKQIRPGSDDAGLIAVEQTRTGKPKRERICGLKRRTFLIVAAIFGILVVCAAVGGGVGGAMAARKGKDDNGGYPLVTSGTIGMAALPCKNTTQTSPDGPKATPRGISNPYLTTGATFNITCRRGIPSSANVTTLRRYTVYNMTSCMDMCAQEQECEGIVYGANLTEMVGNSPRGANCILKDATWEPTNPMKFWFASAVKI